MPKTPIYSIWPQLGGGGGSRGRGGFCVLSHGTMEKDPREESPLSVWIGRSTQKDWSKRSSDRQLPEVQKKDSNRSITPEMEAVHVPAYLAPPGSQQPKSCATFVVNPYGQNCHWWRKILRLCVEGCFGHVQLFATMWTEACQSSLSKGFSRQEYWSVLANTGCHTLLE